MNSDLFDVNSITDQLSLLLQSGVVHLFDLCEPPHLRNEDPLLSGEFMFASSECFHSDFDMLFLAPDWEEWLSDGDSGGPFDGFSVGAAHSGLQTIRPRARKHLVDTDNVPRVHSASHVESVFSSVFGQVFVGRDTGGFQSVGGYLLSEILEN